MNEETRRRLDSIADQIRILDLEVKILNATLDLQELQTKKEKTTIGLEGIHHIMLDQFSVK